MYKFNKLVCLLLFVVLFGFLLCGCGITLNKETISNEVNNVEITNTSKSLTDNQAKIIFKDIHELILSTYSSETYKLDNFAIEFENEKNEENKVLVDVNVDFDMTLIRHPENSPLIKGMKKALSEINNDKEKEIALKTIDGFLKEIIPEYNKTNRNMFNLRMELEDGSKSNLKYKLFYLLENAGQVAMHPAKEYFEENFKEDANEKEKMGFDLVKEELTQ